MSQVVRVSPKSAYGKTVYVPLDPIGQGFAKLTRRETFLTVRHLRCIQDLGYTIEIVQVPIELKLNEVIK